MSGQLEWFICFIFGCAMAWGTLKLFGLIDLIILTAGLSVAGYTNSALAQTYGTLLINNVGNPTPINVTIFSDGPCYAPLTYPGCTGGANAAGDFYTLETAVVAANSDSFLPSETSAQSGINVIQAQEGDQSFGPWTGQSTCTIDVTTTNYAILHWRGAADNLAGGFFSECPPGTPIAIGQNSTNAPWVPSGSNDVTLTYSNGGFTGTVTANGRDATAYSNVLYQAAIITNQLNSAVSNLWSQDSTLISSALQSNPGPATAWDPWLIGAGIGTGFHGMTNTGAINYDPHNWEFYDVASTWTRTAWRWAFTIGFIFIVREWIEDTMDLAHLIPGQKAMSSVGGFVQALITNGILGALLLSIPIAFITILETATSWAPSFGPGIVGLFTEDGSKWQLLMRAGWSLLEDWFPISDFITACLYLLTARFLLLPQIKNATLTLIKLTTCITLCCIPPSLSASSYTFTFSGWPASVHYYDNSTGSWVDDGILPGTLVTPNNVTISYLIADPPDFYAFTTPAPVQHGILQIYQTRNRTTGGSWNAFGYPFYFYDLGIVSEAGYLYPGQDFNNPWNFDANAYYYPGRTNFSAPSTPIPVRSLMLPYFAALGIINPSSFPTVITNSAGIASVTNSALTWPSSDNDSNFVSSSAGSLSWISAPGHDYLVSISSNGIPFLQDIPTGHLAVDGVQAFIEGYGMIIPMAAMAWLRKFRKWGQSAGQRIDL